MKRSLLGLAVAGTLLVSACGSGDSSTDAANAAARDTVAVTASFYPLAYAVERVGGEHVTISSLTKPGAEPHDVELTPKDVVSLGKSALVVYEKGLQPAVDDAIDQVDPDKTLDVATKVNLSIEATDDGHDHGAGSGDHEGETHSDSPSDTSKPEAVDPHFWLDPIRYGQAVTAIADALAAVDPTHATAYTSNAATFVGELTTLDKEFATGLKSCASRDLVTGHVAFAYLADRYDLHQEGITGLSPEAEPTAAAMKSIVGHIKEHKVSTVYAEPLVSKNLTEAVARESGATVAVLDPIEGLTDASAGSNYLEIMRSNLATLRTGQQCQ